MLKPALIAAVVYIVAVVIRDVVVGPLLAEGAATPAEYYTAYVWVDFATPAVPLFVLLSLTRCEIIHVRYGYDGAKIALGFIGAAAVSFGLAGLGAWAFSWQLPGAESTIGYVQVAGEHPARMIALVTRLNVSTPLIEEIVFRYALPRAVMRKWKASALAVVLPSAFFTSLHLPPGDLTLATSLYLLWLFGFSIVLTRASLQSPASLNLAIGAHAGRNSVELATLLVALR